jgi:hypothetical protein
MVDVYFYASEEVEDVGHFVLECEESMERRRETIRKIGRMEGAERLVEEYERGDKDSGR